LPIDTIKIRGKVSQKDAEVISRSCLLRQAIDLSSGDLQYQITTGSLEGTYDSKISIKVEKGETKDINIEYEKDNEGNEKIKSIESESDYYIVVECSLHKVIIGHNVCGGTDDLKAGIKYLHKFISNITEVTLPFLWTKWQLMRIDLAEIYELEGNDAVQDWISSLNKCSYPRRNIKKDEPNGIGAYGQVSSIKFYHKGPEFWAHDRKRLRKYDFVDELQMYAYKILRVEVEIKAKKLKSMYNGYPYIGQVKIEDLYKVYDREVVKFIKEGESEMNIVKKQIDVEARIYGMYSDRLASALVGTWLKLTVNNENEVKKKMKRSNYFKHIKLLKEAGVSWHGTDVVKLESTTFPQDFIPIRTDKRRVVGESLEMQEKLRPFRKAV